MANVGDVAGDRHDTVAAIADAARASLEIDGATCGEHEVVVLPSQERGELGAEPAAPARDQC